jgi:hypothetical protein
MAVVAPILDETLDPSFPLGPVLAAIPGGVLQCLVVWLLFKGFIAVEGRHWLPAEALQLHLSWSYLTLYSVTVLSTLLAGKSDGSVAIGYVLVSGAFAAYFVLTHGLLRREWKARSDERPRRLLLLRVFGAAQKRERLLDALDDTWRRVGRIDLIGGTDLAMRTLGSIALECFLLRRTDAEFLKSPEDVDGRVRRLRSHLEADLRYPVNEIYCYASAWQTAVIRLAPVSDVVLLDLRGFTLANQGCRFELTNVIWYVSLMRVVVLTDATTDDNALNEVAHAAWATLPADSPNAGTVDPLLRILPINDTAAIARLALTLYATASAGNDERPRHSRTPECTGPLPAPSPS